MCSNNSPVCVHAWIAFGHLPTKQVKYAPNLLQPKKPHIASKQTELT